MVGDKRISLAKAAGRYLVGLCDSLAVIVRAALLKKRTSDGLDRLRGRKAAAEAQDCASAQCNRI